MLEFKTVEELQANEELQNMSRYEFKKVKLDGKEVFACTTNQQYEDIIWGHMYDMFEEINGYYDTNIYSCDDASDLRDYVLEFLEERYGIYFVDVCDEY